MQIEPIDFSDLFEKLDRIEAKLNEINDLLGIDKETDNNISRNDITTTYEVDVKYNYGK